MGSGSSIFFPIFYNKENPNIPKKILKTKPKHSPNPQKWFKKDGKISIDENNIWTYHDSRGNKVSYGNGYPDFKKANLVKQEVELDKFENYKKDFEKGDEKAKSNGNPRDANNNTWHHHENKKTLQEINKEIHKDFSHKGGMAESKGD